jgi:hypothetical protein
MDSDDCDSTDDLCLGFAMEEEVKTSFTAESVMESNCDTAQGLIASKCLWCQKVTDESESKLGSGLETFKNYCVATDRLDLSAQVTMHPMRYGTVFLLFIVCKGI